MSKISNYAYNKYTMHDLFCEKYNIEAISYTESALHTDYFCNNKRRLPSLCKTISRKKKFKGRIIGDHTCCHKYMSMYSNKRKHI